MMRNRIREFLESGIKKLNEAINCGHIKDSDNIYIKAMEENDDYVTIRLKGELDASNISNANDQNRNNRERFDKHVILDFESVKRIDCATVAVLVNLFTELKAHDKKLVIINATKELVSYTAILRLEPIITIVFNEEEALEKIASI